MSTMIRRCLRHTASRQNSLPVVLAHSRQRHSFIFAHAELHGRQTLPRAPLLSAITTIRRPVLGSSLVLANQSRNFFKLSFKFKVRSDDPPPGWTLQHEEAYQAKLQHHWKVSKWLWNQGLDLMRLVFFCCCLRHIKKLDFKTEVKPPGHVDLLDNLSKIAMEKEEEILDELAEHDFRRHMVSSRKKFKEITDRFRGDHRKD